MDLSGKICFITGGAQGLGKAYTEALLGNGAKVFFGDVNPKTGEESCEELQKRFGEENVKFKAFDVTNNDAFEAAFQEAVSTFGHIDVMVNNAGVMNEGIWELMIQINVTAVVRGTKLAVEHMRTDKGGRGGRIINISSVAGLRDVPFIPIYGATKHAVRAFTDSLAKQPDVAARGIEYGILCPDAANTDLVNKLDDTKILYLDKIKPILDNLVMEVPTVVTAFLKLLQLEKMNGSMLLVRKEGMKWMKMEMQEVEPEQEQPTS